MFLCDKLMNAKPGKSTANDVVQTTRSKAIKNKVLDGLRDIVKTV